jgi:hypothetical protein
MALTNTVASILPSPNYAHDRTLVATIDGWPARSRDGGETWQRLRGGLPTLGDYRLSVSLAFSPAFAEDGRLYAGIALGETHGEGVYCSTDGGDTWSLCSDGLADLRVYRVLPSPAFEQDRTLLAYAHTPEGDALYRSTDAGDSWRLELRQTEMGRPPLPNLGELIYLPKYAPQIECTFAGDCRRSDDGGQEWQAFDTVGLAMETLVDARFSPHYAQDGMIYFLTQNDLFRYEESSQSWSRCQASIAGQPVFGSRSYERYLADLAVAATTESSHDLLIGSMGGEFYRIPATDLRCTLAGKALHPEPSRPTPLPTLCAARADARLIDAVESIPAGTRVLERLGCATGPAVETGAATQPFEGGAMIWREDSGQIYVLPAVHPWTVYEDTWVEGQPEPDDQPPEGKSAPVRGFGQVWREQLDGPASTLGWATAPEQGTVLLVQSFARGTLLYSAGSGQLFVLFDDGTWAGL